MPQLSPAAALQIALLLSAVPAQYYISRWSGSTAAQRRTSYLNATAWSDWTNQQLSKVSLVGLGQEEEQVSPPIETMIFDNDHGFFGASKAVRSPRPPFVFLRVGEVVLERKGHMIGVVVSWDEELRAPQEWVDKMYSNSEKAEKTPHYKVLFGGPGPSSLMVAYLPPDIPTLENYFTHFDGTRFVMQDWLRELFPED
uniref:Si:dkey-261l7.2 n=1 Tax=Poecilia latipinna TaxID=48699 RepID=A0A3B3UVI9_9TELE